MIPIPRERLEKNSPVAREHILPLAIAPFSFICRHSGEWQLQLSKLSWRWAPIFSRSTAMNCFPKKSASKDIDLGVVR